jgi:hypothetical protein
MIAPAIGNRKAKTSDRTGSALSLAGWVFCGVGLLMISSFLPPMGNLNKLRIHWSASYSDIEFVCLATLYL